MSQAKAMPPQPPHAGDDGGGDSSDSDATVGPLHGHDGGNLPDANKGKLPKPRIKFTRGAEAERAFQRAFPDGWDRYKASPDGYDAVKRSLRVQHGATIADHADPDKCFGILDVFRGLNGSLDRPVTGALSLAPGEEQDEEVVVFDRPPGTRLDICTMCGVKNKGELRRLAEATPGAGADMSAIEVGFIAMADFSLLAAKHFVLGILNADGTKCIAGDVQDDTLVVWIQVETRDWGIDLAWSRAWGLKAVGTGECGCSILWPESLARSYHVF